MKAVFLNGEFDVKYGTKIRTTKGYEGFALEPAKIPNHKTVHTKTIKAPADPIRGLPKQTIMLEFCNMLAVQLKEKYKGEFGKMDEFNIPTSELYRVLTKKRK